MTHLQGIPVTLIKRQRIGTDLINKPIYEDVEEVVENVLVSPVLSDDVINSINLEGKKGVYQLAIPKGDSHDWEDVKIKFFGKIWKSFGMTTQGIDHLIPLDWNKKVLVERYE